MYKEIVKKINESFIEGYIASSAEENIKNFLESNGYGEYYENLVGYTNIAVIKSLHIDKNHCINSFSNKLLISFIEQVVELGANLILLIVDVEANDNNFLINCYQDKGFRFASLYENPLMYYLCSVN